MADADDLMFFFFRSDSGGKPEIYHATEKDRRDSLYRPKEERAADDNVGLLADPLVTNQTDSIDSATLDLQNSPGGKTDLLLTKEDTFPELRYVFEIRVHCSC